MPDGLTTVGRRDDSEAEPSPGGRLRLIGVAALLVILTNAVTFLLPPLLPVIQTEYQLTTVTAVTWIFTLLTLAGGAGFIVLPRMSDVIGDRNTAVIACIALTAGAVIAAVGDSYLTLLIGSVVIGLGGAAQMLPLSFLRRALGESGLPIAVAVLVMATGVGIVVGMIGGGFIVEHFPLRDFFYILAICCAVTTVASFLIIPHEPPADSDGDMAIVGTVWLIVWVGAFLLALTQGLEWGLGALIPLAIGVVGAATWIRAQRRPSLRVFDLALLKSPLVAIGCIVILLIAAVNASFLVLLSNYVQFDPSYLPEADAYGLGLTALQTGEIMVPFAVTFLIGGIVAERPVANGRALSVLVYGAFFSAAGLLLLVFFHDHIWIYLVSAAVVGFGCSIVYSACFALVQTPVSDEEAGMASAMVGTAMALGFSLGSALVTVVLSASTIVIPGTDIEVPGKDTYNIGYWLAIALAFLIVLTVAAMRSRTKGTATVAVPA